jgi:hypothetical protein
VEHGPAGDPAWVRAAAAALWQREPTAAELQRFTTACRAARHAGATAADLCHALFCLDETMQLD